MPNPVDEAVQALNELIRVATEARNAAAKLPRGIDDQACANRIKDADKLHSMIREPFAEAFDKLAMMAIGHDGCDDLAFDIDTALMAYTENFYAKGWERQDDAAADAQHEREAA